jgi:hypothetical protein
MIRWIGVRRFHHQDLVVYVNLQYLGNTKPKHCIYLALDNRFQLMADLHGVHLDPRVRLSLFH